jgi:hypothetical protein
VNEAHHKLFRVSGGRPFYAEVTVQCSSVSAGPVVVIAPTAIEGRYEDWRRAAERGVFYALRHTSPSPDLGATAITVTRISGVDADTCESAVAAAACHATWTALGVDGTHPPRFQGKEIVFEQ